MKYKKYIILGLIIVVIISTIFLNSTKTNRTISKELDIQVPYTLDFYYTDSHGGFFGDGVALGKVDLEDKDIDKLLEDPQGHWTKTPIPKELNTMLFGSETYHSNLGPSLDMEYIDNGYWIFIDRSENKREYLGIEKIDRFRQNYGNYSIGLLDMDEKRFYYIKFDS